MEKHKCKLCFRNFSNGRALGGHMRSHMVNLPVPPKQTEDRPLVQLSFEAESASSSSSSEDEDDDDDDKGLSYGLRENPKRSIRVVDPEFAFAVVDSASVSVIPQDRESETESSKNPTRRRSKRPLNQYDHHNHHHHHHQKKQKSTNRVISNSISSNHNNYKNRNKKKKKKTESCWAEAEPVSSISDATTEEDVAFCLMMLSRDKWRRQKDQDEDDEDEEEEEEEDDDEEEEEDDEEEEEEEAERSLEDSDEFSEDLKSSTKTTRSVRGRYKCETCKRVFRSYQALGGHRASHKKMKVPPAAAAAAAANTASYEAELEQEKKIHECPVCFRVFASGQALGGHKRTHVTGSSSTSVRTSSTRFADHNNFIDLNLPAPIDDDDVSQIENSAVSDAEFLNPNTQIIDAQLA